MFGDLGCKLKVTRDFFLNDKPLQNTGKWMWSGLLMVSVYNLQFARPPEQRMVFYSTLTGAVPVTVYTACYLEWILACA
jgi:hypothetical protein